MPTGHNSPIFEGKVPFGDAACVALCRTANAVILGKTVTTEFANRHPGPTTNPHNAGAHAGRLVVGLGRRGRRRPCAARLRHADRRLGDPARGLLRRDRLQADLRRLLAGRHQDAMPFGRHARPDGAHARRHRAVPRRRARAAAGADRARHRARRASASAARRSGTRPSPTPRRCWKRRRASSPTRARRWSTWRSRRAFDDILDDHGAITGWEGTRNYADERLRNPDKVSAELMAVHEARATASRFERYVAAQRKTVAFSAHVDSLFDKVDVLLCPSAPGEAPEGVRSSPAIRASTRSGPWPARPASRCRPAPATKGLPLGIQLVGLRHEDDRLLSTAAWVAAHLD